MVAPALVAQPHGDESDHAAGYVQQVQAGDAEKQRNRTEACPTDCGTGLRLRRSFPSIHEGAEAANRIPASRCNHGPAESSGFVAPWADRTPISMVKLLVSENQGHQRRRW